MWSIPNWVSTSSTSVWSRAERRERRDRKGGPDRHDADLGGLPAHRCDRGPDLNALVGSGLVNGVNQLGVEPAVGVRTRSPTMAASSCGPWVSPSEGSVHLLRETSRRQALPIAWLPVTSLRRNSTKPSTETTSCWSTSGRRGAVRALPSPTFTKTSEQHPDIVFGKVDTEAEEQLARSRRDPGHPTLMAFRRAPGVQPGRALRPRPWRI